MSTMNKMEKEKIKYYLVDNIMSYLKNQLLVEIEENNERLKVFNNVLNIMCEMNEYEYSYTLKDIDDKLFNRLIQEVVTVIN